MWYISGNKMNGDSKARMSHINITDISEGQILVSQLLTKMLDLI